ncbi:hypothetical protein ACJU26_05785 [Acidithiobacillus sp. M4-SHS-6]|uniref:hypothetical protein n=1 Tax=Acidithiobacillus sp. M4-SHS-6 TaxID=3383024 RepID=UPI0039BDF1EF
MAFEVIISDLSDLMEEKAAAREADMRTILEGRASAASIHRKNAFLTNVREWTEIDMRQCKRHFDEKEDLHGGIIVL